MLDSAITDERDPRRAPRAAPRRPRHPGHAGPRRPGQRHDDRRGPLRRRPAARAAARRAPRRPGADPMSAVDRLPTGHPRRAQRRGRSCSPAWTGSTSSRPASSTPSSPGIARAAGARDRRPPRPRATSRPTSTPSGSTAGPPRPTGRRRRWKVRTRVYADTGERWLEVKTRGAPRRDRQGAAAPPRRRRSRSPPPPTRWVRDRLRAADVHGVDPRRPRARRCTPAIGVRRCCSPAAPAAPPSTATCAGSPATAAPRSATCSSWRPSRPPPAPARSTGGCGSSGTARCGSRSTAPGWRC